MVRSDFKVHGVIKCYICGTDGASPLLEATLNLKELGEAEVAICTECYDELPIKQPKKELQ